MYYARLVPAFTKAASGGIRSIAVSSGRRLRSTVASKRRDPVAEEQPSDPTCTVVKKAAQVDLISQTGTATQDVRISNTSVDFENTKEAYRSKDTLELLRSLLVFKLCSYDFLVDRNKEVRCRYSAFMIYGNNIRMRGTDAEMMIKHIKPMSALV